jgi:Zn-dependent protease with chaperone function
VAVLTARIVLALSLFVGFYLFGLSLVLALLWIPWAQLRYAGSVEASGILAGVGALYLLWALIPPRTGFAAPGPEISGGSQPRLHALIADLARKAGHPMPHAVYLVKDASAFASARPRWHGIRREPVVGVGLPLFALLTEHELAAVVAHEFGHHVGGDVRLGPWQHRTFVAISAALERLEGSSLFLHLPFYAYGQMFLRLTSAASREQELRADAFAARTVGAQALSGALIALEQYGSSWHAYWHGVYVPAVNAGFRPPIVEGYRRFLAVTSPPPPTAKAPAVPSDEHDTHPALDVRLAALGVPLRQREEGEASVRLLDDLRGEELRVLAPLLTDGTVAGRLAPVSWDEWGSRVLPAIWALQMDSVLDALRGIRLSALPSLLSSGDAWWERLRSGINVYSAEARRRQLEVWLGRWVALSLLKAGFAVASGPGAEAALKRDGLVVEPFRWVRDLASGARSAEEWRALSL